MNIVRRNEGRRSPGDKEMFGEQRVESEALVCEPDGIRVNNLHFFNGAVNKMHTHSVGQVLYCVYGKGRVGTETDTRDVEAGDTIYFPPGEKHWHGAARGQDFAHLSIILSSNETTAF